MKNFLNSLLLLGLFVGISGCAEVKIRVGAETPVVSLDISARTTALLKDTSKEDALVLYYLFGGCAEYVDRCGVETNKDAFELFGKVKSKYSKSDGWLDKEGPDNDINDLLETVLVDFKIPKKFDDESKQKFVKIFRDLESGTLKAWRSK